MLNVGCGDWQLGRLVDGSGVEYTGVDVVPAAVEANTRQFAGPGVRFLAVAAAIDPLPPADLVLVKDVLQHWPNAAVAGFLGRLAAYPLALVTNTTWEVADANGEVESGGYRPLDLTKPPFGFACEPLLTWLAHATDVKTAVLIRSGGTRAHVRPGPEGRAQAAEPRFADDHIPAGGVGCGRLSVVPLRWLADATIPHRRQSIDHHALTDPGPALRT